MTPVARESPLQCFFTPIISTNPYTDTKDAIQINPITIDVFPLFTPRNLVNDIQCFMNDVRFF